ncbi:head-tail joining protein, partial [Xenorhabdus budapestensis]|uniref:head-tail joining protein n=1 Tax=Xenorhabdus budapestensis TaxID=290110 RepID=UPI0030DBB745
LPFSGGIMPIDWDKHLLAPLHKQFAEQVNWRPKYGEPYDIMGVFDRAYTQQVGSLDGDSDINTTKPLLGVRDAVFKVPPKQGDKVFVYRANTEFIVSDVQPDSHGGTHLQLNKVKS